jgi:hypothetical protein
MELIRVISVYEKKGEKFLCEYSLNGLTLERLKAIITVNDDDFDLFDVYHLGEKELSEFVFLVPQLRELDFNQVELFLECYTK